MGYSVLDVAKYILAYCTEKGNPISNLQLQKFLYYVQGYSYRQLSVEAFDEDLYCWTYGPVSPDAYYEYCSYIRKPIELPPDIMISNPIYNDKELRNLVENVTDKCLLYNPSSLVSKTHEESPWKTSESTEVIPKEKIEYFFSNDDPLNIEG